MTGNFTANSGSIQSGTLRVKVVRQKLPNPDPAAWTWMRRQLNLPSLDPAAVLQADSRLACSLAGTNATGAVQLNLENDANEDRSLVARLGTNGPVLDSIRVGGFDEWGGNQTYVQMVQPYPDGSQLVEMLIISSPVKPDVTFLLEPLVSGVIFEDGSIAKTLTASDFDVLGQCKVRFIRPASAKTSVCHTLKAFQGVYLLGYKH